MADLKKRIEILQMAEAQGKPLRPEHKQELQRYREQGLAKGADTGGADSTEGERKASAFLTRALGSNRSYEETGVGPRSLVGQVVADTAPNILNTLPSWIGNSPKRQVADSAQDEFIAASLRQDSGAAIPEEEMARQRRIYFPMPGDGPAVLRQKRDARLRAIEGLSQSAGVSITPAQKAELTKLKPVMERAISGRKAAPAKAGNVDAILKKYGVAP